MRNLIAERGLGLPSEPRTDRTLPFRDLPKCLLRGGIGEGVQQSDCPVEFPLDRSSARDGKRNLPECLRKSVIVSFLCGRQGDRESKGDQPRTE